MRIRCLRRVDRGVMDFPSLVVATFVLSWVTQTVSADESIVTVEVRAKQGADARLAFSGGLPLPKGTVSNVRQMRAHLEDGRALTSQFDSLSRWDDGSVRWVLLSAVLPEPAGVTPVRVVVSASSTLTKSESAKVAMRGRDGAVVRHGGVTFHVNALGLPESIITNSSGQRAVLLESGTSLVIDGNSISAVDAHLEEMRVEENGAVRCVLKTTGTIRVSDSQSFSYVVRNTFVSSGRVTTDYTLINHQEKAISSYGVVARLPGVERVRVDGAEHQLGEGEASIFQHSLTYARFRLPSGGEELRRATAPGALELVSGGGALRAQLHEFWERFPSAIAATGDSLALWFWPDGSGPLEFYKVGRAARGSFTLAWDGESAGSGEDVYVVASPAWYRDVAGFDHYSLADFPIDSSRSYDQHLASLLKKLRLQKFRVEEFGFWDFGDESKGPRGTERQWLNNEFGVAWALLFQFLRTGEREFFEDGVSFAKHFRDTDTLHYGSEAGKPIRHSLNHVAGDDYDPAHQWTEGMLLHYLLTGDRRSLDICVALGDVLVPWAMETAQRLAEKPRVIGATERDLGWGLLSLLALAEVSDDARYGEAAKELVAGIVTSQDQKRGLWPRLMKHPKFEIGGATFMMGVLLEALQRYHEKTGDPAVAASLVRASYWLSEEMWHEEKKNFRYKQLPRMYDHYNDGRTIPMVLPGLVYAYHLGRRDAEYKQIVLDTLDRYRGMFVSLKDRGAGENFKSLCMISRAMPRVIHYFYASGLDEPEK